MTSRYNLLPKATHFMPFFADLNTGLHYSYANLTCSARTSLKFYALSARSSMPSTSKVASSPPKGALLHP